ncbi:hypothetical protein V8E52_011770 [Russula decolorans]|jgi:hypothetical protein
MRWLRSKYHALSSLRAPQPYSPSTYKDTTTRTPSMSSIRALPHNCSLTTPKHNYVHHYDTCRSRYANNWSITSNVFDPFTRSPAALSPPVHLNPTLRLTCPTCGHSACSRQNTNCFDPIRHTMSYCEPASKPLPCRPPTLPTWAHFQASQTLSYGRGVAIPLAATEVFPLVPSQPSCATYRRVYVCGSVVFRVHGQSGLAP